MKETWYPLTERPVQHLRDVVAYIVAVLRRLVLVRRRTDQTPRRVVRVPRMHRVHIVVAVRQLPAVRVVPLVLPVVPLASHSPQLVIAVRHALTVPVRDTLQFPV